MSLSALFDCTFIVNLPHRKDRRRAILSELEKSGIGLNHQSVELFPAIRPEDAAGFPSAGVRGCFLSHLAILKEARSRALNTALIIEDDLVISPKIISQFETLRTASQQPWDILYLGHCETVPEQNPLALIPFKGPIRTSHFYAIKEPALSNLIDYLESVQLRKAGDPEGGPMHLDAALTMFRQANPGLTTLIAAPNLGWQRPSRSDIHSSWFQSAPVFRNVYDLARNIRGVLSSKNSSSA